MKSYKELEVWRKGIRLVEEIYRVTKAFPRQEMYGLVSQMQRAAVSIPANIAEGWGRGSTKEYIQFLMIARGSLMELETHLIVARNLGYIGEDSLEEMGREVESIGMMLNRLAKSLRGK